MRPGTRKVINALGNAAVQWRAERHAGVADVFEYGFVIGVQAMQTDPEFVSALLRDFLGGTPGDDENVAMYWNADQTVAALREAFEAD